MIIEEQIIDGITYRKTIYEESDMATEEQKDAWMQVCNTCEYKQDDRCTYCGCCSPVLCHLQLQPVL